MEKLPRVAFLTNLIPPYHKPLFDLLAKRYERFRILISTPMESNRPWRLDWEGLDVVVQKTITFRGLWRHPRGFREPVAIHFPVDTIKQLNAFKADVVISVEMGMRTLLAALYRKFHPRCRLLLWTEVTDSTEQGRGLARRFIRRFLKSNVDGFLAVGSGGARYIGHMGVARERIFQIAYTTDVNRFSACDLKRSATQAFRLLYSGQLVERKGLVQFLTGLSKWAQAHAAREIEFVLLGEGPLRATLNSLPIAGNVKLKFAGVFQYQDLPEIYREAGILVLPTYADTWGVVVNEAMASGLPVLGSVYSQAVEELVEEGKTGWLFRADHSDEMYAAIDRMMNTPHEALAAMRGAARKRALELTPEYVATLIDRAVFAGRPQ